MYSAKDFELAKIALDNSQVIAFPTETVMGLGVYFDDYEAYCLLNRVKNRPEDKPYTLMLGNNKEISRYAFLSNRDKSIINKFMPGPITILLNAKETVPGFVTHSSGVIGVRIPDLPEICEFINYCNKGLLVPSANKSREKPAINSDEVKTIFKDELGYVFEGSCIGGVPSTIVDLTGEEVKILREGPISLEDIINAIKEND